MKDILEILIILFDIMKTTNITQNTQPITKY